MSDDPFKGTDFEGMEPTTWYVTDEQMDQFEEILEAKDDEDYPRLRRLFAQAPRFTRGE